MTNPSEQKPATPAPQPQQNQGDAKPATQTPAQPQQK
jgi:hypothetical protein